MNLQPTNFTPATDIYSLGATLYKLLTGVTPPSAVSLLSGDMVLPPLPAEVKKNVRECVEKSMIPQCNSRLQSIDEFVNILIALDDEKTVAKMHTDADKSKSVKTKTIIIAVVILLAGISILSILNNKDKAVVGLSLHQMLSPLATLWGNGNHFVVDTVSYSNGILTAKGVSYEMVKVQGGTFFMGATSEQGKDAGSDEKPAHNVTVSSYYIGKTEVTQELWQAVMGSNPSHFKGSKRPVERVSWNDCQKFVSKLNLLTGKHFRLPTEAEWEFAARGGTKSKGYKYSGSDNISSVAWYTDNSGGTTHEVGQKVSNELGIYDMSGNVFEWCLDWYGDYSRSSQTNPSGAAGGFCHVDRGGSCGSLARRCRSSYRRYGRPGYWSDYLGFRLALSE